MRIKKALEAEGDEGGRRRKFGRRRGGKKEIRHEKIREGERKRMGREVIRKRVES